MILDDLNKAAHLIKSGKNVIFPTETVWGIGANAYDHRACKNIYAIKNRPEDNPLIIHLHEMEQIPLVGVISDHLLHQLSSFIPGPLTLILEKRDPAIFTCGLKTVAVRVPASKQAQLMIKASKVPIAAPSANLSGKPSITRFDDVLQTFEGKVDAILKGDDSLYGIESTVIDLTEKPIYLRPGFISFEEIQVVLPDLELLSEGETHLSPGMKYRHYAPLCKISELSDDTNLEEAAVIGFHPFKEAHFSKVVKDNIHYAKELYAFLIECDKRGLKKAYFQKPQENKPLYYAIIHRLLKASS
ncbi:L-threonylcarbamoyladenylate synthase [Chlamydiales bacterium]|nr:L-threonylcarbamoyladenylate synthase [Chlamydiales bacterium]